MKQTHLIRLTTIMIITIMVASFTQSSAAQIGTAAGTQITNTATVTYTAGTNPGRTATGSTSCYVGQKVVIGINPATSSTTTVDNTTVYLSFTITNNGNGPDTFNLTIPSAYGTATASLVQSGSETVITSTGSLASGATFQGRIKLVIPSGVTDNTTWTPTMTITSTVTSSGNIVVANPGATQTCVWTVTIAKPVIAVTLTPTYSTNKLPGESQSFALTITNTGHAATTGTSTVTLKYDNTNFTGVAATGGASSSASAGTATWTINSLPATTGTVTVNLTATINQTLNNGTGVTSGTVITTGAATSQVTYNDGVNSNNVTITSTNLTVGTASGVLITKVTADQSGNPGATEDYTITVKNLGNHTDTFNIVEAISSGPTLTATPVISTTVGGSAISNPQSITAGTTTTYYVRYIINANAADVDKYIRTITATSVTGAPVAIGGQLTQNITITTTVTAPNIAVTIATTKISGFSGSTAAAPVPGDVLQYTVTIKNNGSGAATPLQSVNTGQSAPSTSGYSLNANSVDLDPGNNGFAAGDLNKGQGGTSTESGVTMTVTTYDPTGGNISINISTLPAGATAVYQYRVTVY